MSISNDMSELVCSVVLLKAAAPIAVEGDNKGAAFIKARTNAQAQSVHPIDTSNILLEAQLWIELRKADKRV